MLTHRALTHDAREANSEHRDVNVVTDRCYILTFLLSPTHIYSQHRFISMNITIAIYSISKVYDTCKCIIYMCVCINIYVCLCIYI